MRVSNPGMSELDELCIKTIRFLAFDGAMKGGPRRRPELAGATVEFVVCEVFTVGTCETVIGVLSENSEDGGGQTQDSAGGSDGDDGGGEDGDDESDPNGPPRPNGRGGTDRLRAIATITLSSVALLAILFILTNLSVQISHSLHLLSATKLGVLSALYGLAFRSVYRLVRLVSGYGIGEDERIGYAKPKAN